jgi:DNA-binding MarR family transcriptional regulator
VRVVIAATVLGVSLVWCGSPEYSSLMNKRAAEPVVFALLGTAAAVQARLEAALEGVGLSLAKAGLLRHLAEAGEGVSLSELARHQQCVRSNITQLVDRLEKDGFVKRRADAADRRGIRAVLTAAGRKADARARQVLARTQQEILRSLRTGQATELQAALEALGR